MFGVQAAPTLLAGGATAARGAAGLLPAFGIRASWQNPRLPENHCLEPDIIEQAEHPEKSKLCSFICPLSCILRGFLDQIARTTKGWDQELFLEHSLVLLGTDTPQFHKHFSLTEVGTAFEKYGASLLSAFSRCCCFVSHQQRWVSVLDWWTGAAEH